MQSSLYVSGEATIYRGYLVESGLFGEEPTELDALIHDLFPRARWGEKRYYLTDDRPAPETLARFAEEVQSRIDQRQRTG